MTAALLSACLSSAPPGPSSSDEPLITIGETELGLGDAAYLLDWIVEGHTQYYEVDWQGTIEGVTANRYFLRQVLDMMLEAHITGIKAAEFGYSLTEEEEEGIEWEIAFVKDLEGGAEAFAARLERLGLSEERYRFYTYIIYHLREKMLDGLFGPDGPYRPDDSGLWQYYLDNYHSVSYIFLSGTDDYGNLLHGEEYVLQKSVAEALQRQAAESVNNEQLTTDNELFEGFFAMVTEYGMDYFMSISPEGMSVPLGMIGDAFDRAVSELGVGEVSGVVEDNDGFYIILRLPADHDWFERNADSIWVSFADAAYTQKISEWAEGLPIAVSDSFWEIDVLEMVAVG
jgi:hypothetical protein